MSGQAGVGREKFVEEGEAGIFHIITMEGWKQPSKDERGRVILDRIVLREVVCRSWDEETYELLYNVDEGRGLRVCKYVRGFIRRALALSAPPRGRIF